MNTNIFVPSKINVGFQNRDGTYTGKLAYVVYFDERGKLRKEASWSRWRDKNIPNEIFDNEPTEGFVLNKKVGGIEESYGSWDVRKTYTRIYDPRGFEFEITIPNLLWILENCNCIKGKGLEGQFVYGWDGKELVLVPVESPDYKEIRERNKIIHNNEFVKAKDLIIGATYETLKGDKYVYMGKYNQYETKINCYHEQNYSFWNPNNIKGWEYPLDSSWHDDVVCGHENRRYKEVNNGKVFWFIKLGDTNSRYSCYNEDHVYYFKSIARKFSNLVSTECEKYSEYYEMLHRNHEFSPIDHSKSRVLPTSYDDFENKLTTYMTTPDNWNSWRRFEISYLKDGRLTYTCIFYDYSKRQFYYEEKIKKDKTLHWYEDRYETKRIYVDTNSIRELYDKFKPMYGEQYLENGRLYLRRGYYGSEE